MQKIVSLFQRNYETDRLVRDEVVPGAEWVQAGEGVATQKVDGTCCLIEGGKLYARYDAKVAPTAENPDGRTLPKYKGERPVPEGFKAAQEPDPVTGHWPGWVLVTDQSEYKWHRAALAEAPDFLPDGTYELCGPRINGNPEGLLGHVFLRHGFTEFPDCPRDFEGLKRFFQDIEHPIEGIVWHHPDGRMVKIKAKDFGFKRIQLKEEHSGGRE
jgi:hypothetical protein